MGGINLSQSIHEKQALERVRATDRGVLMTLGGFVLLICLFGGTRWYAGFLERQSLEIDAAVASKTAILKGPAVDRIVDLVNRSSRIVESLDQEPDPATLLDALEQFTLPTVRLTRLEMVRGEHRLVINGVTTTLKEVAQQMLAYKRMDGIERITVDQIGYTNEGKITFALAINQEQPSNKK